jgi:hypothetical protein
MILTISAVPVIQVPLSISMIAKADSGCIFLWDGHWATIRRFLAIHVMGGYEIPTIESQLYKGAKPAFEIETSETLLTLVGFRSHRSP